MLTIFKAFIALATISATNAHRQIPDNTSRVDSVALSMTNSPSPFHKYDSLIDKSSAKPPMSFYEQTMQTLFGKSLEKMDFERSVDNLISTNGKNFNHELRAGK